jgi:ribonuclease Z
MFQATILSKVNEDICIKVQPANQGFHCIVDCGEASDLSVRDCQNAELLCISHCHIDHFVNFDSFLRHQIGSGKRYIICGPEGIAERVQHKILGYHWNLIEAGAIVYEIREVLADNRILRYELLPPTWELRKIGEEDGNVVFQHADFEVKVVLLDHRIPTAAYLFQAKDSIQIDMASNPYKAGPWLKALKQAILEGDLDQKLMVEGKEMAVKELMSFCHHQPGQKLGVILDHGATEENHAKIAANFSNADIVLIEAFFKASDKEFAEKHAHSYSTASAGIMRRCGVKQAIPVHFSRKYEDAERVELMEEFLRELEG